MRKLVLAVSSIVVVAACGGGSATNPSPTPTINFTMVAQNGSGVAGTGTVVKVAGSVTVTIKLTGLTPNSSHISHVHNGACAKPGGIAYPLSQLITASSGSPTPVPTLPPVYPL